MQTSNDLPISLDARISETAPIPETPDLRGLVIPAKSIARFLYTSNPFYILSADLVFIGLRMFFGAEAATSRSFALPMSLAAYTLLLATTACILIRFGKLWDDLRSLLVLVVMMFLAIATSLDDVMAADHTKGTIGCLLGYSFAIAVTELVLRSIRLRLPSDYRVSYHAMLGLIFLYPVALGPLLGDPDNLALQWSLLGFSPLAAITVALLIPAARRGRINLEKNGSPWPWPLYPWTLFVVLVAGLCLRSYSLCVSFHYVGGSRMIFGPYFLVPIGLASAIVGLELGIATRRRVVTFLSLMIPLGLALSATAVGRDDVVFQQFLETFVETLGASPFYLSLCAAILFFAYAATRRVRYAWEFMSAVVLLLAFVVPDTLEMADLVPAQSLPLITAGLILVTLGYRCRDGWRTSLGGGCLVFGLTTGIVEFWPSVRVTPPAVHLAAFTLLLVGTVFEDRIGRLVRWSGALFLLVLGVSSALDTTWSHEFIPDGMVTGYPLVVAIACVLYARVIRDRRYLASAGAILATWIAYVGFDSYGHFRKVTAGFDQIACGLCFFMLAIAISLRKAGLWPRALPTWLARARAGWAPSKSGRPAYAEGKAAEHPLEA